MKITTKKLKRNTHSIFVDTIVTTFIFTKKKLLNKENKYLQKK